MNLRDELKRRRFERSWRRQVRPAEFAAFGDGAVIHPPLSISDRARVRVGASTYMLADAQLVVGEEGSISIGARCYIGRDVTVVATGEVVIEDDVMAVDRVLICDSDVPAGGAGRPLGRPRPVRIGRGAFIGTGAIVLPGVTIGAGAYVGGGAVVTRSVPANALAVGNPARVVRHYDAERGDWVTG